MDSWPTWLNFLVFLILPVAVIFGPLLWRILWRKDDNKDGPPKN